MMDRLGIPKPVIGIKKEKVINKISDIKDLKTEELAPHPHPRKNLPAGAPTREGGARSVSTKDSNKLSKSRDIPKIVNT